MKQNKANICFDCKNAVPDNAGHGCPWSRKFEPVPGWTAKPVKVGAGNYANDTYCITECPLFDPDDREKDEERRPVTVRCIETGAVYESITKAARCSGCSIGTIAWAIKAGNKKEDGLHWERVQK